MVVKNFKKLLRGKVLNAIPTLHAHEHKHMTDSGKKESIQSELTPEEMSCPTWYPTRHRFLIVVCASLAYSHLQWLAEKLQGNPILELHNNFSSSIRRPLHILTLSYIFSFFCAVLSILIIN